MAQPTQLTQSELDFILEQRKLSPFTRLKTYLKKLIVHALLALLITSSVLWLLVAFTEFKLPFLYSETQEKIFTTSTGGKVTTKRKQVVLDLKPKIQKDKIVIQEGNKNAK